MSPSETKCLGQHPIRLFHQGACHIFAAALAEELADENYVLKRIPRNIAGLSICGAYHVVAAKDGYLVDASGIKRENDYKAWMEEDWRELLRESYLDPAHGHRVELHDVTIKDLKAHHHDEHGAACNQWGLFIGDEFFAEARARATELIKHWQRKYRVSVLKAGLEAQ